MAVATGVLAALLVVAAGSAQAADKPAVSDLILFRDGALVVRLSDGRERSGLGLVGFHLPQARRSASAGTDADSRPDFRVDAIRTETDAAGRLLAFYAITRIDPDGTEHPYCVPDRNGQVLATPLPGETRPDGAFALSRRIALTCSSGAQAKCLRLGYAPWRTAPDGTPMLALFNACTRMIRADYCGTGESHTSEGMEIAVADRLGLHEFPARLPGHFQLEAVWNEAGALCIEHARIGGVAAKAEILASCPRLAATARSCSGVTGLISNASAVSAP